ncbi:hypothetical protein AB6A40_006032 [Gnathostoma spinigerum]|uniref:Uncharacterized protein n=1 Tax=Gnathostoma spinigerum TaxID=75299 RepID=A0ABD6EHD5_9BILA
MAKSRRELKATGGKERVRTHLFFSSQSEHHTAKRKRRTHNKLHQMMQHRKDEIVQAGPPELEPTLWTGNQRVMHFGPMAQRDPFFYYYPKGWDVLYPANFGFFPYRATKFRGSSPTVCISAFGAFLTFGGTLMTCLAYFVMDISPVRQWLNSEVKLWHLPPIYVAGPTILVIGLILLFVGLLCSIASFQVINEKSAVPNPARVRIFTQYYKEPTAVYHKSPYQPLPPPAFPVLKNKYAHSTMLNPISELKLYPPVLPGYSTLSLHGKSPSIYLANPYNTLRAISSSRFNSTLDNVSQASVVENARASSATVGSRYPSDTNYCSTRSKSVAPNRDRD